MSQLRELREAARLTQPQLAKRSGVSTRTICSIENGKAPPRQHTKRRLLLALGLPFSKNREVFPRG